MENIRTVSELTDVIKEILGSHKELRDVQVRGEISNLGKPTSGHIYFTLKDENSQISCAFFSHKNRHITFKLEDGVGVIVNGSVEVYKMRGNYQIIVDEVHLVGIGDLYQKFLILKEKLKNEGLFDQKHKKPLPEFPVTVGVVTSINGAALADMLCIIGNRWPFMEVIISPATVQGVTAAPTIVEGIERLNELEVDVIIIGRGGGSFEDLWCFNEEIVARAVFSSKVPIISAVGHETDSSISDFVADVRASTPSNAAEILVPDKDDIQQRLRSDTDMLFQRFKRLIHQSYQDIDNSELHMINAMKSMLRFYTQEYEHIAIRLNDLNPQSILKRGYSMVLKDEKVIKSVKNIEKGDRLKTIMYEGKVESIVERTEVV